MNIMFSREVTDTIARTFPMTYRHQGSLIIVVVPTDAEMLASYEVAAEVVEE
jgi:hypothetical protein